MRYLPSSENGKQVQNDYKLAKQALAKMRLKKFRDHQSSKKRRNLHNFSPFLDKELGLLVDQSNFGSTVRTSWVGEERRLGRPLSSSTLNLDACAVCLEEFKDGEVGKK
uniref:Uncharacterized protein n=1 Tax=Romanomermis culicivorax TaxID=13658 RepID=A0A915KXC9_ROMCU